MFSKSENKSSIDEFIPNLHEDISFYITKQKGQLLHPDADLRDDLYLDSFDIVEILNQVEDKYHFVFEEEDLIHMHTVMDVTAIAYEHVMKRSIH